MKVFSHNVFEDATKLCLQWLNALLETIAKIDFAVKTSTIKARWYKSDSGKSNSLCVEVKEKGKSVMAQFVRLMVVNHCYSLQGFLSI